MTVEMRAIAIVVGIASMAGCQRPRERGADEPPSSSVATSSPVAEDAMSSAPPPAPRSWRTPPPLPDPLPGARREVSAMIGAAQQVAIGDLDGDGRAEIVVGDAERLRVVDVEGRVRAEVPVRGGVQQLLISDVDGDGRDELVVAWGMSREHLDALARVTVHRLVGAQLTEEEVATPVTSRHEITALVPWPGRGLLVAYFADKYVVRTVVASRASGAWTLADVDTIRTATTYAVADLDGDGAMELAVGRVYGDAQGSDGEAFVRAADGTRTPIPTTRGVRALATADVDGDGRAELYLADGWHQNYGQHAQGLLTWARWQDGGVRVETIEDTAGQYTVGRIVPADVDGDGRPELITQGSGYVRVFRHADGGWRGLTIAGAARALAVGDLDGAPGAEVLVVGDRAELVSLRGVGWP